MTDQQINAAIAELCGWIDVWRAPNVSKTAYFVGTSPSGEFLPVPNYCHDLNAMHEAEMTLTSVQLLEYIALLFDACYEATVASARQRAEAFLRTLGKWEEVQG